MRYEYMMKLLIENRISELESELEKCDDDYFRYWLVNDIYHYKRELLLLG